MKLTWLKHLLQCKKVLLTLLVMLHLRLLAHFFMHKEMPSGEA